MSLKCRLAVLVALIVSMSLAQRAGAIILADNTNRNKSAPSGSLASSGWQWQGNFGAFTGTPIARNYFIAASHIGGSVGQTFTLGGKSFTTTAMFDDPNSDLRIWKTSQSFGSWAPIYTGTSEIGKTAMLFGRGTSRGSAVSVNGTTHGWMWGAQDGKLSWGENKIKTIIDGGSGIGKVLSYSFDRSGHGDHVSNEGTTSAGDSSGAIFVKNGTKWQLAALNYSADGPFSINGGSNFMASIYDKGGLSTAGQFTPDGSTDFPGNAFATRISSNQAWIKSVIGSPALATATLVPEPASLSLLTIGALLLRRKR
jgi:hypothetical protein